MRGGFDDHDTSFRTHFDQNFASNGWDYDSGYSHAYLYGYDLAGSGKDWSSIVPVMEEVTVVEKRILLREELYIRRRKVRKPATQKVKLRKEEVRVEDTRKKR